MSLFAPTTAESRRKLIYGASACALVVFVGLGVFANNGWLPHTDGLTGKKTGWFGHDLPKNAGSTWNPLAAPLLPTATPQLSKEYIYAGQRVLAVEDANANAAPPGDLAVWRPSTGYWWVFGGPGSQQTNYPFGATNDIPAQGDFDGDGKTDFAVFRPGTQGQWFVLQSSDGQTNAPQFGTTGDKPVEADFDGDGRTDIAIYRTGSSAQWFILRSSDNQLVVPNFGTTGDVAAPGDFDGDGKADLAVWRGSNNSFYVLKSSDSVTMMITISGVASGDVPVIADYDGDGKADCALFDPTLNTVTDTVDPNWYVLQSSTSTLATKSWGTIGDIPVPNDYDGDGKCDFAIWRPGSQAYWFITNSHDASIRTEAWGTTGDIPVPAYFRR